MKGAKMCKEGLQLKQISPHLTQKTTQNLMVVVCFQTWYPSYLLHLLMLPALTPNARRDPWHTQMRPSPKSVHPVASVARCNANGAPGSVSQNLMDRCWWTLPVAMHWHAPMLRTLLSSTSHQEEKDWRVGRKTVYSTIAQHTEMGSATIQIDVASSIMVIMSSDHWSCRNMSKLHETTIGSCNDKKDTSKHIETIHACSDFPCWFPKLWNAMNLASFVHTPWMKYMVFKFQQKSDHSLQSFQKKDAT